MNAQESELWRQRLRTDCDFVRFRKLHTAIVPCIVWKFPNTRTELKLADFIGQLWTCVPDSQHSVCRLCNGVTEDILCHAVAECICTSPFRDSFLDTIHSQYSGGVYTELDRCHGETFCSESIRCCTRRYCRTRNYALPRGTSISLCSELLRILLPEYVTVKLQSLR